MHADVLNGTDFGASAYLSQAADRAIKAIDGEALAQAFALAHTRSMDTLAGEKRAREEHTPPANHASSTSVMCDVDADRVTFRARHPPAVTDRQHHPSTQGFLVGNADTHENLLGKRVREVHTPPLGMHLRHTGAASAARGLYGITSAEHTFTTKRLVYDCTQVGMTMARAKSLDFKLLSETLHETMVVNFMRHLLHRFYYITMTHPGNFEMGMTERPKVNVRTFLMSFLVVLHPDEVLEGDSNPLAKNLQVAAADMLQVFDSLWGAINSADTQGDINQAAEQHSSFTMVP